VDCDYRGEAMLSKVWTNESRVGLFDRERVSENGFQAGRRISPWVYWCTGRRLDSVVPDFLHMTLKHHVIPGAQGLLPLTPLLKKWGPQSILPHRSCRTVMGIYMSGSPVDAAYLQLVQHRTLAPRRCSSSEKFKENWKGPACVCCPKNLTPSHKTSDNWGRSLDEGRGGGEKRDKKIMIQPKTSDILPKMPVTESRLSHGNEGGFAFSGGWFAGEGGS